jgi:uncharacterized delta-60 repeat protein
MHGRRAGAVFGQICIVFAVLLIAQTAWAAAGDLDPSFSGNGIARFGPTGIYFSYEGVALQSNGKIVVAGGADGQAVVARLGPHGALDPTFGNGGITAFTFEAGANNNFPLDVAVTDTGKIVVVGYGGGMGVARILRDGTLDAGFAGDGARRVRFASPAAAEAVAIQADGRIVLAGSTESGDFAAARVRGDGSLDPAFGTEGRVVTDMGTTNDQVRAAVVQPDGRIVLGGEANGTFALARYLTNGAPDPTFGTGGKVVTTLPGFCIITGLVVEQGVGLVAGGWIGPDPPDFGLVRYDMNGDVDPSFGDAGVQTTDLGTMSGNDEAFDLRLAPDGSLVQVGTSGHHGGIVRYSPDGTPDPTFGVGGRVLTPFNTFAFAVAVQPDSNIVVAGQGNSGFVVFRLLGS